jgi:C4-dicarboxylate transporter DctM subunit
MFWGVYFILFYDHISGIAIYVNQLTNLSNIFLNIGLHVFIGMTLKETDIPKLIFDSVRSFHLAPPLFASLIIFITAYPTAFTNASNIGL